MEKVEKLDRTKPYGLIYGQPGLAYEQDGIHYDPEGKVVEKWSSPERIAQERVQAQKRKAREEALAAAREQKEIRRKLIEEL